MFSPKTRVAGWAVSRSACGSHREVPGGGPASQRFFNFLRGGFLLGHEPYSEIFAQRLENFNILRGGGFHSGGFFLLGTRVKG